MKKEKKFFDAPFFVAICVILFFGVVMVYDASVVYSLAVFGGKFHFLISQTLWAIIGLGAFFFAYLLPVKLLEKYSRILYFVSLFFLILVLIPSPFSPQLYGARRWLFLNPEPLPLIPIFGRLSFQPSDFAKFAYVLYLSQILTGQFKNNKSLLGKFLLITLVPVLLIFKEPDFGTALTLFGAGVLMLFVSGFSLGYFLMGIPLATLVAILAIFTSSYRRHRLLTFLNPDATDSLSKGYHVKQVLLALGSGGFFGLGLGQSRQKYGYLPEVSADSIFAIIGEEFGFVGTGLIIGLLLFIIFRILTLAKKCNLLWAKFFCSGIACLFGLQAFINIASMCGLIPLTGVPIPLISYGGSAMVFTLLGFGLVMNLLAY